MCFSQSQYRHYGCKEQSLKEVYLFYINCRICSYKETTELNVQKETKSLIPFSTNHHVYDCGVSLLCLFMDAKIKINK